MQQGKKTPTPGLYETTDGYLIKVKATHGSLTIQKAKQLPGVSRSEAVVELERLRAAALREAENRVLGRTTTVTAYARLWLEDLGARVRRQTLKRRTAKTHARNLERFILPILGEVEVDELSSKRVRDWLRAVETLRMPADRRGRGLKTYKQAPKPYAKATLANAWRSLREFCSWIKVEVGLPESPARDVRWRDMLNAPEAKERVWLTQPETALLVAASAVDSDPKALPLVLVSLAGALRASESSALDRSDFDAVTGSVSVTRSHSEGEVGRTKTPRSRRCVSLPPTVVEAVNRYLAGRTDASEILFPTSTSTRLTPAGINRLLARCAATAGLTKKVTSHCLRRTTNNRLRQTDGELVAQAVTGHVTQAMTAHYSNVDREERLQALEDAFGGFFMVTGQPQPEPVPG